MLEGHVLAREDQPADARLRLTLAVRLPEDDTEIGSARKVRVNVPLAALGEGGVPPGLAEGAETIAVFIAMCLWPAHFAGIAYGYAALCLLTVAL